MNNRLFANQEFSNRNPENKVSQLETFIPTVLVVDDSYHITALVALRLIRAGYCVLTANSGIEAYSILQANKVTIVVMDIQMPDLDGFDTTIIIRHKIPPKEQPIIIAYTSETCIEERAYRVGMNDIIYKKDSTKELLNRIEEWLLLINPK